MIQKWTDKILLLDLFEGLKTTFKELLKPKVTIRYPEERLEPADRFRGMFRFSFERCIACKLCAVACPIDIIYIDVHDETREIDGKNKKIKVLDRYDIDVTKTRGRYSRWCPGVARGSAATRPAPAAAARNTNTVASQETRIAASRNKSQIVTPTQARATSRTGATLTDQLPKKSAG